METVLTLQNVLLALTFGSFVFSIYLHFRKPQEILETKQAVAVGELSSKATLLSQKEVEGRAALLEQQVKLAFEANEKKFSDLGARIDGVILKVDNLIIGSTAWHMDISNQIVKLTTIIEERVPKTNLGS